jgi:hypothetical protein
MNLALILREQADRLFLCDVRKAADVLCGFDKMDLQGVCDIQIMQSKGAAFGSSNLDIGVTAHASRLGRGNRYTI